MTQHKQHMTIDGDNKCDTTIQPLAVQHHKNNRWLHEKTQINPLVAAQKKQQWKKNSKMPNNQSECSVTHNKSQTFAALLVIGGVKLVTIPTCTKRWQQ